VHTQAHGLSGLPTVFAAYIQCLTAEHGYGVGEIVMMAGTVGINANFSADTTNTYIVASSALVQVVDRTTFAGVAITAANWKMVVVPFLVN
jgi:hypothetical protein